LHMPNPGDGFTVVTAMRHCQPDALTLLVSGYPDVQSAMAAILAYSGACEYRFRGDVNRDSGRM
ncbi:MAG: hypothetical protein WCC71_23000, partial [Candidatus Sulfotelmatobacter sp.]